MDELKDSLSNITIEELETIISDLERDFLKRVQHCLENYEELLDQEREIQDFQNQIQLLNDPSKLKFLKEERQEAEERYRALIEIFGGSCRDPRFYLTRINQYKEVLQQRQGRNREENSLNPVFYSREFEDYCNRVFGENSPD